MRRGLKKYLVVATERKTSDSAALSFYDAAKAKCSSDCPKSTDLVSRRTENWQNFLRPHMLGISCSYYADEALHC